MSIYKFRVIIDTEEDVFRDIEIETGDTFEKLHLAIVSSFDFEIGELASFYMSDDNWNKGAEIPLLDMGAGTEEGPLVQGPVISMKSCILSDFVNNPAEKIVYVYDFLRMWCFYIELVEVKKSLPSTIYPRVSLVFGEAPDQYSKEMDLFDGLDLGDLGDDKSSGSSQLTGDPEIDQYLSETDDFDNDEFQSLDDLDDDLY